jgi:hypothetical protein
MEILEGLDITLGVDDILRGEGANPDVVRAKKPALLKTATEALRGGFKNLRPTAILHTVRVIEHRHEQILLEGENKMTGELVSRHLSGAVQIASVVCTIGMELETEIEHLMNSDPMYAMALDGLGNAAVEKFAQQVCARIGEQAQVEGLTTSAPLSPGEPDWPVEVGQPQVFALLDPSRIGITLTSGGMMVPKKSISFVVGIGPEMTQIDMCELCSLRERCHYRHA